MTAVGTIGILLCLVAFPLFPPARTQRGFLLFFSLLAVHLAASVAYYSYAQNTSADTSLYYYDSHGLRRAPFEFSTIFVIKFVQWLKDSVGGTYLDYFLLFQAFGFWGVLILQRVFEQVPQQLVTAGAKVPYWLLFLPGIHFWTGAIGKDAPLFLAISLSIWAAIRPSSRLIWFGVAVVIMLLFRPHIALLATAAGATAILFGGRSNAIARVALILVSFGGLATVAATVENTLQVDLSNPSAVSTYLEQQQQKAQWVEGSTTIQNANFVFRLFSLLFRPLFVDSAGFFGLVASIENLVFLFVVGFLIKNWRDGLQLFRAELALRYCFIFALTLTVLLAMTYYNVGLGLRQKVMIVPALLTLFVAAWLVRRPRAINGARARVAAPSSDLAVAAGLQASNDRLRAHTKSPGMESSDGDSR